MPTESSSPIMVAMFSDQPMKNSTMIVQSSDSGIASVLNATAALFTAVLAHYAFRDERITIQKIAGLALGFFGVVVLASRSWVDGQIVTKLLEVEPKVQNGFAVVDLERDLLKFVCVETM